MESKEIQIGIIFIFICLFSFGCEPKPKSTTSHPKIQPAKINRIEYGSRLNEDSNQSTLTVSTAKNTPKEFYLRIAFFNDAKSQPLSRNCRMWIRGFGDFYPVRQNDWKFGGTLIEKAGPFDTKDEHVIYFYPDYSDESREIKIPFKYLPEMNPKGSIRDMLNISVELETITFFGTSLKDVKGKHRYIFDRKTCKEMPKANNLKQKKQVVKNGVIGKWLDKSPYLGSRVTIYGKDGNLFMEKKYNEDDSIGKEEIIEMHSKKGRVFQSKKGGGDAGEYYLIDKQSNLQLWDKIGVIWTAKKVN